MNIEKLVDNKNLKLTTARRAILEIFNNSSKPLCYDDIKNSLSMDKATFYRNITKFEEEGIVNSFESNDKKRYYEIQNNPHAHFICTKCSAIECIPEKMDFKIPNHKIDNIIIKGICSNCLNK
ncbi:Fur family transcriptional regulator [Arcobacter sp. CECT 8985]|uniref:Fur family transcriptional regulator n=1 Tax=Arcobacter sp. CECT 8985 TaxID=1935424 RepID=UPI00100B9882|nr:transcriptional repressor [Arcobacter sp. CECT 8985]RXJ87250.1 Fur family transcriptional regulator [Arcobacter sp. CECT 8985]